MTQVDSNHFMSAGGDGMLVLWNTSSADGKLISRIPEPIFSMAYHTQNHTCAVGTRDGAIYEIDVRTLQLVRQWKAHPSAIFDLAYLDDELLSLGNDGTLVTWKSGTKESSQKVQLSQKSLRCAAMNANELWIGGSEGIVWELNRENLQIKTQIQASTNSVFALQLLEDGLFTVGRDAHLHRWQDGMEIADIAAHWYTIHALSLSPNGRFLLTGSMDKSIKVWDSQSLTLLKVIDRERYNAHASSVNKLVWMDENHFLSCSDDRSICLFQITED